MPAALATASAGAGAPRSSHAGGLATATSSAGTGTGVSRPVVLPGPATSTASARPAGAIVSGGRTLPSDFATGPFAYEPFGGMRGLTRGRASAGAGHPVSREHLAVSAVPGAFGDDPFGDAPFGGDGSSNGLAHATATAPAGHPTSVARYNVAAARAIAPRGTPLNVTQLLDEATAEADRVPTFTLRADWDGDSSYAHPLSELTPVVTGFDVDRSIASELPDDIGLVQGTAATKMSVTLAGTWKPDGPILGKGIILSTHTLMPASGLDPDDIVHVTHTVGLEWSATGDLQVDAYRYWRSVNEVAATEAAIFDMATGVYLPETYVRITSYPPVLGWHVVPLPQPFEPVVGHRYKIAFLMPAFPRKFNYFTPSGPGGTTVDDGPLRRYSAADASFGFQASWNTGSTFTYPNTVDSTGQCHGIDLVATVRVPAPGNPDAEDTDPVKALAPYRNDADLAGKPIIGRGLSLTTGMQTVQGPITQPRFTGTVSAFSPSAAAREVVLEGLDPVDHLRKPITQYAWAADPYETMNPTNPPSSPARMNSQWYIDRICRANGFFASPPPGRSWFYAGAPVSEALDASGLLLSATMHGSTVAEKAATTSPATESWLPGTEPTPSPSPFVVGDHPFGMLAPNPDYLVHGGTWGLGQPIGMIPGAGYSMPIWIRVPAAGSTLNEALIDINPISQSGSGMRVLLVNGKPTISLVLPDGTSWTHTPTGYTLPPTPEWQFFGFWWNFTDTGGTMSVYSAKLGTRTGGALVFTPIPNFDYNPSCPVAFNIHVPFTNLSLYHEFIEPAPGSWLGETWSKTAYIDIGANDWGGILEQRNTESYGLLKEIVGAEFGFFGFDEDGFPHFRSRAVEHPVTRSETVTSERSLTDLVTRVDEATVRNSIDVTTSQYMLSPWEVIFEAQRPDEFILASAPPGGVSLNDFYIPLPDNCAGVWTGFSIRGPVGPVMFNDEDWNEARRNPALIDRILFSASYVGSPTVQPPLSAFTFAARLINSRTMLLRITNNVIGAIRLATPDDLTGTFPNASRSPGEAALIIPGRIVGPNPPVLTSVTDANSIARYGRRTYDLGGQSVWRQRTDSVVPLAYSVLEWTAGPKPVLDTIDVPHHPRRRLHDQVTVIDNEGLGAVTGKLAGIRTTFNASDGARDQLLVRPTSPPAGW